jgi:ribonuclease P protein component
MLPQKNRLPAAEFKARDRKIISTPYFLVKFSENHKGYDRFGFIISTNAVKKSVDRHYWKRHLSEYVQRRQGAGCDFLVIVSPRIQDADERNVKTEIEKVFHTVINKQQATSSK